MLPGPLRNALQLLKLVLRIDGPSDRCAIRVCRLVSEELGQALELTLMLQSSGSHETSTSRFRADLNSLRRNRYMGYNWFLRWARPCKDPSAPETVQSAGRAGRDALRVTRRWRVSLLVLRVVKPVRRLAAVRPQREMVGTPQCASCHFCTTSPQKLRKVTYNVAAAGWSPASLLHAEWSIAMWSQPLASSSVTSVPRGHNRAPANTLTGRTQPQRCCV